MKINNKKLGRAADVSAARGSSFSELRRLLTFVIVFAVVIYFSIGLAVDAIVSFIPFETESRLFSSDMFFPFEQKEDSKQLKRLETVLDILVSDPTVPPLKYRLAILNNNQPNAFAFPGGTIGVTQGLLDALEEDIALAFVLGHELGHFHNRDHLRGIGRAAGSGILFSLIFGGQMGSKSFGNLIQAVLQRNYSRGQEEKADRFGAELVFRTYSRASGIDQLFRILEKKESMPDWAYMFATHPAPEARIEDLKKHMSSFASETYP
jgi:Zn-dependent protease with chaperone function